MRIYAGIWFFRLSGWNYISNDYVCATGSYFVPSMDRQVCLNGGKTLD